MNVWTGMIAWRLNIILVRIGLPPLVRLHISDVF